jgi:hypothetical protein
MKSDSRTPSLLAITCLVFAVLPSTALGAGGIVASPHDFSQNDWNTRQSVCSPCHQAHNTAAVQSVPLWVHATSGNTFTPYTSPQMNAVVGQPSGPSLACLSCHDGSLAINQKINGIEGEYGEYISTGDRVGPDLHAIHPVSITYDTALATADGGLEDPLTYKIGDPKPALTVSVAPIPSRWSGRSLAGKTIDEALLFGHRVECSSCHDVHKQDGSAPSNALLLRVNGVDSTGRDDLLCRTCHSK